MTVDIGILAVPFWQALPLVTVIIGGTAVAVLIVRRLRH
jgi:hypothetical protein